MSFDSDLDKKIDQAGESLERGLESFWNSVISPFFSAVTIGMSEILKKRLFKTKIFWAVFGTIIGLSITISIIEKLFLSRWLPKAITESVIWIWLYERQKIAPYPIAMLFGIIGLMIYFRNKGIKIVELRNRFTLAFERAGLYSRRKIIKNNKATPEYPVLYKDGTDNDGGRFFVFKNPGLALETWLKEKENVEATLQEKISEIGLYKKNPGLILLKVGGVEIPEQVEFNQAFMSHANHSSVVVGLSKNGPITHDFQAIPHLLIGGATGSGKTVEASAIAYQCISHLNGILYIIDFKGGADYTDFEDIGIDIIFDRGKVATLFKQLMIEHKRRVSKFKENRVKNIEEYNQKFPDKKLRRIFVLVDELAELTDYKSTPKDEHELLDMIMGQLSSIARLTRSTGINLLLSTQRPDANVVPGQIKNNVPGRLSGYFMDDVAYRIVLDYIPYPRLPDPTEIKGRFIYSRGAESYYIQTPYFQSHHVDKKIKLDYQSGLLTKIDLLGSTDVFDEEVSPVPSQRARYLDGLDEFE